MTIFWEAMLWPESRAPLYGIVLEEQQATHRLLTHRAKHLFINISWVPGFVGENFISHLFQFHIIKVATLHSVKWKKTKSQALINSHLKHAFLLVDGDVTPRDFLIVSPQVRPQGTGQGGHPLLLSICCLCFFSGNFPDSW